MSLWLCMLTNAALSSSSFSPVKNPIHKQDLKTGAGDWFPERCVRAFTLLCVCVWKKERDGETQIKEEGKPIMVLCRWCWGLNESAGCMSVCYVNHMVQEWRDTVMDCSAAFLICESVLSLTWPILIMAHRCANSFAFIASFSLLLQTAAVTVTIPAATRRD